MKKKSQFLFLLWVFIAFSGLFISTRALEGEPTCEFLEQNYSPEKWVHVHETGSSSYNRLRNLIENDIRKIVTGYEFGYKSELGGTFIVNITDPVTNDTISNATIVEPSESYTIHRVLFESTTDFLVTQGNLTIDIIANDSAQLFLAANNSVVYLDTNALYWNGTSGWVEEDKVEYHLAPILEDIPTLSLGSTIESQFSGENLHGNIDAFFFNTSTHNDTRQLRFFFQKTTEQYSGIASLEVFGYRAHSSLSDMYSFDSLIIPSTKQYDILLFDHQNTRRAYVLVLRPINNTQMVYNFTASFEGPDPDVDSGDSSFFGTTLGKGLIIGAVVLVVGGILFKKYNDSI